MLLLSDAHHPLRCAGLASDLMACIAFIYVPHARTCSQLPTYCSIHASSNPIVKMPGKLLDRYDHVPVTKEDREYIHFLMDPCVALVNLQQWIGLN